MGDKTLVERLRMTGKRISIPCPDGIDGCLVLHPMINTDPLCKEAADTIEAQATRIEALKAALRIEIWNGLKRNGMSDDAATALVKARMTALESQP